MKYIVIAGVAAGGLLIGGCTPDPATSALGERVAAFATETAAELAFLDYQAALGERRGTDAAALVTARTLDHYAAVQRLATTAMPNELATESVVDRLTVALLRTTLPDDVLAVATPAQLFAATVDTGLVGQQVGALVPRDVEVRGGTAIVEAVDSAGRPIDVPLRREAGTWKVDVAGMLPEADAGLRELAATQGVTETELILATVAGLTGQPVGPEVFNPP
jgi:hypothetical protein